MAELVHEYESLDALRVAIPGGERRFQTAIVQGSNGQWEATVTNYTKDNQKIEPSRTYPLRVASGQPKQTFIEGGLFFLDDSSIPKIASWTLTINPERIGVPAFAAFQDSDGGNIEGVKVGGAANNHPDRVTYTGPVTILINAPSS